MDEIMKTRLIKKEVKLKLIRKINKALNQE